MNILGWTRVCKSTQEYQVLCAKIAFQEIQDYESSKLDLGLELREDVKVELEISCQDCLDEQESEPLHLCSLQILQEAVGRD